VGAVVVYVLKDMPPGDAVLPGEACPWHRTGVEQDREETMMKDLGQPPASGGKTVGMLVVEARVRRLLGLPGDMQVEVTLRARQGKTHVTSCTLGGKPATDAQLQQLRGDAFLAANIRLR
jgi:hypothetical protein